jgi:hypothetical protein
MAGNPCGRISLSRMRQMPAIAQPFTRLGRKKGGSNWLATSGRTRKLINIRRSIIPCMLDVIAFIK